MKEAKLALYILLRLEGYSPARAFKYSEEYFSKFSNKAEVLKNMYA